MCLVKWREKRYTREQRFQRTSSIITTATLTITFIVFYFIIEVFGQRKKVCKWDVCVCSFLHKGKLLLSCFYLFLEDFHGKYVYKKGIYFKMACV